MTTTGTTAFDLDLTEIIDEAFERCGKEARTGYDYKTARRSLSLLLLEWANRGLNLWTIDSSTVSLVASTATYDLPADTVDLLDCLIRTGSGTSQQDLYIERISQSNYAAIPNKNITGRPNCVWVNRQGAQTDPSQGVRYPEITVWPVPPDSTYTFVYYRLRRMQDVGTGASTQDVPYRFLPAMVAGLAFHLSFKIPEAIDRIQMLEANYEKEWQLATDEDREKADFSIRPRMR